MYTAEIKSKHSPAKQMACTLYKPESNCGVGGIRKCDRQFSHNWRCTQIKKYAIVVFPFLLCKLSVADTLRKHMIYKSDQIRLPNCLRPSLWEAGRVFSFSQKVSLSIHLVL